jgi:ribonuclease BN (tRNA processing enzyme)
VSLELTVLGCAGTHPGTGRVCSGYLLQAAGTSVLLDAGNGSTANLQRLLPLREIDAVVVSHRHIDHCIDLVGGYFNLRFDPAFDGRMPLYAPAEVAPTLAALLAADSPMLLDDVFTAHEVDHGDHVELGPMHLTFARSLHPPPTVSTRIEVAGATFVYSGDSAGGEELVAIARGADLFLCEATWVGDPADHPPGIHLTAAQAAEVARDAEVAQLVLTHLAGATDRDRVLEEAAAVYDGPIALADDLASHAVPAES